MLARTQIQGEAGSLVIEKLSECRKFAMCRAAARCRILPSRSILIPCCTEAELFATLVDEHLVDHPGLAVSRITARLLTEIRRQTGVIFPKKIA